jgi:uncharacterized membrane protein SpoIIM required for sporulation
VHEPQDKFVERRRDRWNQLEVLIEGRALHRRDGATIARAASLYRAVCTDLVRCSSAGYTPDLTSYLDGLAGRAHNALYGARPLDILAFWRLLSVGFPRALRRNGRYLALAAALFLVPGLVGLLGALHSTEFAYGVLPPWMLEGAAESYAKGFGGGRESAIDTGMAGFYVANNVGIAFRCFATGILLGSGSLFFLVYNGLVIGTVIGYVTYAGHGGNIFTFVCGHSPFELTAIVLSGAAGLRMGYALISTGGRTRVGSLRAVAPDIAQIIAGAAAMLVIAAGIEAFWSPSSVPPPIKWAVAATLSLLVTAWLALAGRGGEP